jgi:hypothetical protein
LKAGSPKKLTDSDRANLKRNRPGIVRLLTERNSPTPGLSPAGAQAIHEVLEAFPGSRLMEIGSPRPYTPASASDPIDREEQLEPDQLPLFPPKPPAKAEPERSAVPEVVENETPASPSESMANDPAELSTALESVENKTSQPTIRAD